MEELLIKKNEKILYAIAYENPLPRIRYILANDRGDALRQVFLNKQDLGRVVSVAPAIGAYGKHEERKRIYCYG